MGRREIEFLRKIGEEDYESQFWKFELRSETQNWPVSGEKTVLAHHSLLIESLSFIITFFSSLVDDFRLPVEHSVVKTKPTMVTAAWRQYVTMVVCVCSQRAIATFPPSVRLSFAVRPRHF